MIECVEGTLLELTTQKALLLTHGVGYGILIPLTVFDRLCSQIGSTVRLYTSHIVREDSNRLFGFVEKREKELFELLQNAIGPKTALSLLGHLSPENLKDAIGNQDSDVLVRIPGIGKKSAERILLELKGKLDHLPEATPVLQDALQALTHLGYTAQEARKKLIQAQTKTPHANLQELLRLALQPNN